MNMFLAKAGLGEPLSAVGWGAALVPPLPSHLCCMALGSPASATLHATLQASTHSPAQRTAGNRLSSAIGGRGGRQREKSTPSPPFPSISNQHPQFHGLGCRCRIFKYPLPMSPQPHVQSYGCPDWSVVVGGVCSPAPNVTWQFCACSSRHGASGATFNVPHGVLEGLGGRGGC